MQRFCLDLRRGGNGHLLAGDVMLGKLLAIQMRQPRDEVAPVGLAQFCLNRPVFLCDEGLNLGFTLADQAQRNRLHAPRRTRARQFAPQDGRD